MRAGQGTDGGWNKLMMLDTPGLADVHIAIAPAAHGELGSGNRGRQLDDLRGILFRERAARAGAFLFIDRPEQPAGHGAGATTAFNDRFGPCLLRFATASQPPTRC